MSDVSQNIGEYNSDSGLSFDIEIPDIPIPYLVLELLKLFIEWGIGKFALLIQPNKI